MQTRVSTKGQLVLPQPIRRKMGLRPGDALDASLEDGRIILTPNRTRARKVKIVKDTITGLPVLSAGPEAPPMSSKEVHEILSSFP